MPSELDKNPKRAGRKPGTTKDRVKLGISISRGNAEWLRGKKDQGHNISTMIDRALSPWISVDDHLPRHDCFVDIFCKSTASSDYGVRKTDVLFNGERFVFEKELDCIFVSHWMQPPQAP